MRTRHVDKNISVICGFLLSLTLLGRAETGGTSYKETPLEKNPVLHFQEPGWLTAPFEIPRALAQHQLGETNLWASQTRSGDKWAVNAATWAALSGGLTLVPSPFENGRLGGRWKDHEKFPTLACENFKGDWSDFQGIEIKIFSESATGEALTLGLLSDSSNTAWKDYYLHTFTVDFQGAKTLSIPFTAFETNGPVAGYQKIDGVYFFTKAFGHDPHPYSVLVMGLVMPVKMAAPKGVKGSSPGDPFLYRLRYASAPVTLNHGYPETSEKGFVITPEKALSHQNYYQSERALYKYFPKFNPGFPSFDPKGKAYLNAGETVEWVDETGSWQTWDIKGVLTQWAKGRGWKGLENKWGAQGPDTTIRFDESGDIYLLENVEPLDEAGNLTGWTNRLSLLLHRPSRGKIWAVYPLPPHQMASFEKIDGHNRDALKRPPVILLGDYSYFPDADKAGYLVIPEKKEDGSLYIPPGVKYGDDTIGVNYHSGDGTTCVTSGNKVFVAWGWVPVANAHPKTKEALSSNAAPWGNWKLPLVKETELGRTLPAIPPGHPALNFSFGMRWGANDVTWYSRDGVPTFVTAYDLVTKTMASPVYIGQGGGTLDEHNWPALNLDSQGTLHALINGHHNPLMETETVTPGDISKWTAPVYGNGASNRLSYATFTCDRYDTLYTVHRSTTGAYNNRLVLFRKKKGQGWESERTLVAPFKFMYNCWYHKMSYDPTRHRLFLTYYSVPNLCDITWDMFEFFAFYFVDQEKALCAGNGQNGGNRGHASPLAKGNNFYNPRARDIVTLVSEDSGDHWRLAVTEDFK